VRELGLEDWERFEQFVLPHVDAAFNLARWLLRERNDAEDVTQDALLRAKPFLLEFSRFRCPRITHENCP